MHQLASEIFFSRQVEKCGRQNVSIKFFIHSETQKRKDFKDNSCVKIFLLLNYCKSQIPEKALKYRVAYNLVEMEYLPKR